MNTAKSLFQKQKELRAWWATVTDDPRFQQVMLYADCTFRAESMDHYRGAKDFAELLSTLGIAEETGEDVLSNATPGLHHNIDKED